MFKMDVERKSDNLEEDENIRTGGEKILLTCVGAGFKNLSKITL